MLRLQAFKFELCPDGAQRRLMRRFAGCRRFVYNRALALQQSRYAQGEKHLGYAALCAELKGWKDEAETSWLCEAPSQALQQSLKDLDRAFQNFFEGRVEAPKFKKKGYGERFRYPQGVELDQPAGEVFLPKLGWLRYRGSRKVLGEIKNTTVSHSGDKWFIAIQTEREVEVPVQGVRAAIGVDVGIVRFATFSDQRAIAPINSFRNLERALAKTQQSRSRKVKGSRNWRKAGVRVARIQARIGNCRRDYLHRISSAISETQAIVCVEDLRVRNMSKSASGTAESPGRNVSAKSGLNKSILDQGWGEFRRQLEYKLAWKGGILIAVPPAGTSRCCPCCDHEDAKNRPSQALFRCTECGFETNADEVGAINILSRGLRIIRDEGRDTGGRTLRVRMPQALPRASRGRIARLACEANPTGGRQQEPKPSESREAQAT
jgi:putative transposase